MCSWSSREKLSFSWIESWFYEMQNRSVYPKNDPSLTLASTLTYSTDKMVIYIQQ